MAYTVAWNEASPLGSDPANTLHTIIQNKQIATRERLAGIFGLTAGEWNADPIVPKTLTLTNTGSGPLTLDRTEGAGLLGHIAGKRAGGTKYTIGLNASDSFTIISTGGLENFNVTDAGAGVFRAGVTATSFAGNITGNVTGNLTGTVLTAAQGNITSLGILTGLRIAASGLLYFDGGVDTYVREAAGGNEIDFYTNGVLRFYVSDNFVNTIGVDLIVSAAKKFYLDGGTNTYIHESSGDIISFVAGGVTKLSLNAADIWMPVLTKLYFDGGSDTYIHEVSADILQFVTQGTARWNIDNNGNLLPVLDNARNLGAAGNRILNLWVSGTITGNVTGNLTGTILTGAQANITSLGTLTSLTVSGTTTTNALTITPLGAVSNGANDSGGAGFRLLRVPN